MDRAWRLLLPGARRSSRRVGSVPKKTDSDVGGPSPEGTDPRERDAEAMRHVGTGTYGASPRAGGEEALGDRHPVGASPGYAATDVAREGRAGAPDADLHAGRRRGPDVPRGRVAR